MEITSLYFGLLSIVAIFIYYLLNLKLRIIFLAVLSCCFIATYSYNLLLYVTAYSLFNYIIAIKIHESRFKKSLFRIGIIVNISQLILLKYASFTFNPLFELLNVEYDLSGISKIIIPVGISFFTFQGIGYLINVHLKWEKPENNFIHFLLYIVFYPRFLSGPIDRSNQFLPQLKVKQAFDTENITDGLRMVLFGFFKKIAIANQLAPLVNSTYANLDSSDGSSLWIVLLIQPLYLYFDFSGYTDIAIGFAKTLGIQLRPNFNRPFLAENVTTFWKRFHISLSSWFNDYVYMRTAFKLRKWGIYASIFAASLTWILFGIWHGAGWTFMLLGILQALAINYEYFTKKWRMRLYSKLPGNLRIWLGRILTYLFYGSSLVFFFSPDIKSVFIFFSKLPQAEFAMSGAIRTEIFYLVLIFMFAFMLLEIIKNDYINTFTRLEIPWSDQKNRILRWTFYILILSVIIVFSNDVQQFIYFQF